MGADSFDILSSAWRTLRLSVRCPSRVPTWDAILITAASPHQAELYQLHLERAKHNGRIASHTVVLAVPDPQGRRIGSGGATLSAIRELAMHLNGKGIITSTAAEALTGKRVLLVHAGGDSKRVPWANAIGKAFLPLPFLAEDHSDEPVPLLFDHILAISSRAVSQFPNQGGLFIMTGDVLPCFDASTMSPPQDGTLVVTVPASLEVAANHGVILSQSDGCAIVDDLLQKPSMEEMYRRHAVAPNSTALLDTGIFSVTGGAWQNLIALALAKTDPVQVLVKNAEEMSLYEEMAGAWVSARHDWLKTRPLGMMLIEHLGSQQLYHYCAHDLRFLHFGTTSEILQHLTSGLSCRIARRHFTYVSECSTSTLSAVILASEISPGATVGDKSLIFNCSLGSRFKIGSNCVVVGVHEVQCFGTYVKTGMAGVDMMLPDGHCLWEAPLKGDLGRVMLCCSIQDNPKVLAKQGGTFCGKSWKEILTVLHIKEESLWVDDCTPQDLWHAKLFPILPAGRGISFVMWLMANAYNERILAEWRSAERLSLAELQERVNFRKLYAEMSNHQARLAALFAKSSLQDGLMRRNLSTLTREILCGDEIGVSACRELLSMCPSPGASLLVPASRVHQARMDLSRACGDTVSATIHEESAWQAVADETAAAVSQIPGGPQPGEEVFRIHPSRSSTVRLPVRIDIAGGWSDTPPWSIERTGSVLNMAIRLNGDAPVGAEVLLRKVPGVSLYDDVNNSCIIEDPVTITAPFDENDPFRLVKAALVVTGFTKPSRVRFPWGLEIKTWAAVPRGSGLGTSSILAATVIRALLEVSDGNGCDDNIARLVLILEQLMGTGGGWQDQVGGIYPGLKCTTSMPGHPLKFIVEEVDLKPALKDELEHRMLLIFTGQVVDLCSLSFRRFHVVVFLQVRLAHMVLQKVVMRYLQRDSLLISSIERLVQLAKLGQEAFANCDLDCVGKIMLEAWEIHQELDPYCSNVLVDAIFKKIGHLSCGYKLVGAGGGGFAIVMAKDRNAAFLIKDVLSTSFGDSIKLYSWSLC